jgi:very-short-patch-repair endonuclease
VPEAPIDRRIAVVVGGRLGSVSALRSYGVWTVADDAVHVSWGAHGNIALPGRRLAEVGGPRIVPHWRLLAEREPPRDAWRESPEQALAQALRSEPPALALAAVDSALHHGLISRPQLAWIAHGLPAHSRALVGWADDADSGLESIVRYHLRAAGIGFRRHALVHGLEVDFLLGSLVIETDGGRFHAGAEAFERDRRRDAILGSHGYIVLRWSYRQIIDDPDGCLAHLRAHLVRGDHRRVVD